MSRHSKRTSLSKRQRQQRGEAKAARRRSRVAKGRTKSVAVPFKGEFGSGGGVTPTSFIGGVPQHSPSALTRAMMGMTKY
jgi:hypothetical protein